MAFSRQPPLSLPLIGPLYLAAYGFLDWASFIYPLGAVDITPWNPQTGLSIALVLLCGRRSLPLLFIAPFLGNLATRHLSLPLPVELLQVLVIGSGYGAASVLLLHPVLRFDARLMSIRDLALLMGVTITSAAIVAAVCVTIFADWGVLLWAEGPRTALRFWVGDVIGIAVVTPFLLFLSTRRCPTEPTREAVGQFVAIIVALWLVFWVARANQFQLFYLLFLPIIWIAVRTGIEGVSAGIVMTQVGLIIAMQLSPHSDVDVTSFQVLMLVLSLTGLTAGMLVSERRRTELELRHHQNALAQVARLSSMGELAAAIAHEINQPLTATGIYTRLVRDSLRKLPEESAVVIDAADKAVAQVDRAAEVVKRLRKLVRFERSELVAASAERIVEDAVGLFQPDLERAGLVARMDVARNLPLVIADTLQIQQVLLNLLRNSVDAMEFRSAGTRKVTITASLGTPGYVEFRVRDTGPGFAPEIIGGALLPFATTKPGGLGMGLALSRTIVEAHGGKLWLVVGQNAGIVHFTLPVFKRPDHD
jgi:two-component system, LuxR family, sensor kinase FixL